MAQGLSVLARLLRKGAFEAFQQGLEGPRFDAYLPALPGRTRGSLGTMGSRVGPQTRNPDAQEDRDRQTIQSPIMQAFLTRTTGRP